MTLGYWHSVVRPPLTANGNFYIDAALGSDTTGDGSSGNPWATLQYAYNWIQANVNFAGYQCNIHMADGIYTGGLVAAGSFIGANNAGSLLILGNSSDPAAVVIHTTGADCVDVSAGGSISLKHLTVVSTTSGGAGGDGVTASYAGELFLYDMNFGACSGNQMYAAGGGSVIVMTGYQITGVPRCTRKPLSRATSKCRRPRLGTLRSPLSVTRISPPASSWPAMAGFMPPTTFFRAARLDRATTRT